MFVSSSSNDAEKNVGNPLNFLQGGKHSHSTFGSELPKGLLFSFFSNLPAHFFIKFAYVVAAALFMRLVFFPLEILTNLLTGSKPSRQLSWSPRTRLQKC